MTQDDSAKQMETAFKDALKQSDKIVADASKIYKKAEVELDAAKEARRIAESAGEQMANEFYEGKRKEFIEATRTELLRNLARKHIELGKTNREISLWLDVEQKFIQKIREVVERVTQFRGERPKRTLLEGNPKLFYDGDRDGYSINFESLEGSFTMWLQFALSKTILIGVPSPKHWEAKTSIPLERRELVLTYIAEWVLDDQVGGLGSFIVGEDVVTISPEEKG